MLQPQPPPAHLPQVVVPVQLLAMVVEIQAVAGMAEAVCQRSCREHRPCARSRGPAHCDCAVVRRLCARFKGPVRCDHAVILRIGHTSEACQRSCGVCRPCACPKGPALTSWPAMYFRVLTCNRPVLKSKSIQKVRTGFPTNKPRKERSTFALMLCLQSNDPSSGKGKPA
eukprot:scaffold34698_cov16-Tisochrysis_lutea.AAC.2